LALSAIGLVLFIGAWIVDHYMRRAHIKAGREIYVPVIVEEEIPAQLEIFDEAALDAELEIAPETTPEQKENEN
jgi:hypothetical protein